MWPIAGYWLPSLDTDLWWSQAFINAWLKHILPKTMPMVSEYSAKFMYALSFKLCRPTKRPNSWISGWAQQQDGVPLHWAKRVLVHHTCHSEGNSIIHGKKIKWPPNVVPWNSSSSFFCSWVNIEVYETLYRIKMNDLIMRDNPKHISLNANQWAQPPVCSSSRRNAFSSIIEGI